VKQWLVYEVKRNRTAKRHVPQTKQDAHENFWLNELLLERVKRVGAVEASAVASRRNLDEDLLREIRIHVTE
jgi:hypothetical protein